MLNLFRLPTTFQRYLFLEILQAFTVVLLINAGLMVIVGVVQQAKELGVSMSFLLPLLPYIVLTVLPFTMPAALLLAVCIVYGRVSADNEIVSLKAAGVGPLAILMPAIFIGLTMSGATFLLMSEGIPNAASVVENAILDEMDEIALNTLNTTHFLYHPGSRVRIMVSGMQERTLLSPVFEIPTGNGIVIVQAAAAQFEIDPKEQVINLFVEDAVVEFPKSKHHKSERVVLRGEKSLRFVLPTRSKPKLAYRMGSKSLQAEVIECRNHIEQNHQAQVINCLMAMTQADFRRAASVLLADDDCRKFNRRINNLRTERHARYSMAWSCLFFALLGSPLSILLGRRHYLTTFLICFVPLICIYYPIVLGVIVQCKEGLLDPAWAVWIGNALLALAAIVLLQLVRKH